MGEVTRDTTGMTPADRHRMGHLADEVDTVVKGDAAFFKRRPDRSHRLRLMSRPERQQLEIVSGRGKADPGPGREWIVIVRQIAPGARMRRFLVVEKGLDLDLSEAACRIVYDSVTGGSPQVAQIEASLAKAMEDGH